MNGRLMFSTPLKIWVAEVGAPKNGAPKLKATVDSVGLSFSVLQLPHLFTRLFVVPHGNDVRLGLFSSTEKSGFC